MSLNFPNNPALNQTFTNNGVTWRWNGTAWNLLPVELPEIEFDVDQDVYFVTVDGENDAARNGQSYQTSWRSIRYALDQITGPAVLRIGAGTFSEQLPLTVPEEVSIVGDSQRTTIVQPAAGLDINGDPNDQSTMWLLNDSSLLKGMTFTGLTGFEPGNDPEDVGDFSVGGVFIALDPDGAITNKSPYVLECSSISTGGIGAIIDGSQQASGNHSILFHAYTCINDDGIGIWASNNGRSEVVSCFTYFCHAGYVASSGGQIRSLNGNNSYGKYGSMSTGFDASEQTVNGQLYGDVLEYDASNYVGSFSIGNTITGLSSGAVATITYIDESRNKIYYKSTNEFEFSGGEEISNGLGASVTIDTGGIAGQEGFILVVAGFSEEPKPGGSVEFQSGDAITYVIRSVTGSYLDETSVLTLLLTGEKITQSFDGDVIRIRYRYSQTRLTGHDFLNVGTGGRTTTNYPGIPTQPPSQGNEVIEQYPGRVYFSSTDQDGNFRIGDFFRVDQSTGITTLNATAFDLSGLNSIRLGAVGAQLGELINEFSADDTLSGNSNSAVPTEAAVRGYFTKVDSDIIPAANEVYDLGSNSARWRDLYLSGNTIRLGNLTLKDDLGNLAVLGADNQTPAQLNLGNLNILDNTISSTNTNGNVILAPNGAGFVSITKNLVVEGNLSVAGTVNIPADQISGNISLTTQVVGTLPVSNGGTGLSSYTANRILYSASANSLTTSSALTFDGTNFTVAGNITVNTQGDVRFADADSSNWVAFQAPTTVVANVTWTLPDADGTDGQVLSTNGSGTLSWKTNIPENGYFRNRIINGDMRIFQRNNPGLVTSGTSNTQFFIDRWGGQFQLGNVFTIEQSTDAPAGFINSLKITTTNATTPTTSHYFHQGQVIEGLNFSDLNWGTANAKSITVSFWTKGSITGTYALAIKHAGGQTYGYLATYIINSADTWEYKAVVIPGPTGSTWPTNNTGAVRIHFDFGTSRSGDLYASSRDTWLGENLYADANTVKMQGTANATWFLTGVQVEVGSVATPFERRPYSMELMLCQRYYWVYTSNNSYVGILQAYTSSAIYGVLVNIPVTMRATPSVSQSGSFAGYKADSSNANLNTTIGGLGTNGQNIETNDWGGGSGLTAGHAVVVQGATGAKLIASAEL